MFTKEMKRFDQYFVLPVAKIQPCPTQQTIAQQLLNTIVSNFVGVFRSYNRSCLQKKRKDLTNISYL